MLSAEVGDSDRRCGLQGKCCAVRILVRWLHAEEQLRWRPMSCLRITHAILRCLALCCRNPAQSIPIETHGTLSRRTARLCAYHEPKAPLLQQLTPSGGAPAECSCANVPSLLRTSLHTRAALPLSMTAHRLSCDAAPWSVSPRSQPIAACHERISHRQAKG